MATEQEFVDRCRNGDQAAFDTLLRQYQDRVYNLVRRTLGGSPEVDDVVQEVFIEIYRSLPHFRGEAQLSTWVFRLTLNVCRQHLRQAGRQIDCDPLPEEDQIADQTHSDLGLDPAEIVARVDVIRCIREAVDTLPEIYREAVALHYLEDLSFAETAAVLGCHVGTVKARVHRAVQLLRRRLADLEDTG